MQQIKISHPNRSLPKNKYASLREEGPVMASMMLLAYGRGDLQDYLKCRSYDDKKALLNKLNIEVEESVEDTFKKAFIKTAIPEAPIGDFSKDKEIEKYKSYCYLIEEGYHYFYYAHNKLTGFDAIAYEKSGTLLIGISGSDDDAADWIDNNLRLVVSKGVFTPTQFKNLNLEIMTIVNHYEKLKGCFPKTIKLYGHSLGGAVATMAFGELFFTMYDRGCALKAYTFNGAPFHLEQFEQLLTNRSAVRNQGVTERELTFMKKQIIHCISRGDLLNHLAHALITESLPAVNHIGYTVILTKKNQSLPSPSLKAWAEDHVDFSYLWDIVPDEARELKTDLNLLFKGSRQTYWQQIKALYKKKTYNKKYITVQSRDRKGSQNE